MSVSPEVSVVMSVYNGASYLRRAIDSVLSQEGVEFEFIIVNDGSTDESLDILKAYQGDARVRIIDQQNQGLTAALIRGCGEAKAELIARQDSDDVSLPGRLAALVEALREHPQAVMASSWTRYVGPEDEVLFDVKRPADPALATHQLLHERSGPPAHGSVMFRKSAYEQVGGYRREFYYGQDSDLWLRMGREGLVVYVPEVYYHARKHPDGISGRYRPVQAEFGRLALACHQSALAGEDSSPWCAAADQLRLHVLASRGDAGMNRRASARASYLIGASLQRNRDGRAVAYLLRALRSNPLLWRAWARLAVGICRLPWLRRPSDESFES